MTIAVDLGRKAKKKKNEIMQNIEGATSKFEQMTF